MSIAARSVEVILAGQSPAVGHVARPAFGNHRNGRLLRSHAMYLRLHHALRDRR